MGATKEMKVAITGMTCAACANRIEKGLRKLDGVENANVNLALETSSIEYDPEAIDIDAIQQKIIDLGYGVVTEKEEFHITGMTCAACSARVEKGLNKLDGVMKANVNLALETATVEFNPAQIERSD